MELHIAGKLGDGTLYLKRTAEHLTVTASRFIETLPEEANEFYTVDLGFRNGSLSGDFSERLVSCREE